MLTRPGCRQIRPRRLAVPLTRPLYPIFTRDYAGNRALRASRTGRGGRQEIEQPRQQGRLLLGEDRARVELEAVAGDAADDRGVVGARRGGDGVGGEAARG